MENEKNKVKAGVLYLVATPIGNLADMTERGKKVLSEVDFIAAEDTRNSLKLLSLFGIRKELVSYFEHNKKASGERIVERLQNGESCALITDAGMPAISDPGEDIVRMCADAGVVVSVIPGACAAVSALALSGLCTGKFAFEGFLSANKGEREKRLAVIRHEERTLIFYEAPHKLKRTLDALADTFGKERKISLCREITKLNEDVMRTTIGEAIAFYDVNEPRGEYVLIVEGEAEAFGDERPVQIQNDFSALSPEEHVQHYMDSGMQKMDAIKAAAKDRGMTKSELYKILNT